MDNLKVLREEQERRFKKLTSEIKDREKALQRLEKQVKLSSDHLSSLDQGIERLGESLYLIETNQDGKSELSTLQGQVKDLQQAVSDTQKTFQEQDKKNNDTVSDLRSQLKTSDAKVHILETRGKELEKTNQNLRSGKEDISRSLDEYRLQKDNYESLLTELRGVNEELKTETSELVIEKDTLTLEKNSLVKKNETLHTEIEKFSQIEVIPNLSGDLTDQEIKNLDLSEWDDGEVHIDSVFPWEEVIAEFEDSIDEFAKKEKKKILPKGKLRELESLHDSLRKAKKKLEDYFKTPPIARKDLDSEISAIQDAMADVLKGTGMKRVETNRYIFSLRRTPVYYKVVSEKTAVNSLRKKKLGRFINTIETLDMAKLKTFLKNRGLTIPGLKKMTADVSIYIYEKHEEGEAELIYVVGPEGFEEEYEDIEEEVSSSSREGESSSSISSSSSESSSEEEFEEDKFSEKINAPTFAYQTVYGKNPEEFLSGRTDAPKKMWQGRAVDEGLKDEWLEKLNNLPVEIRSTDEGKSKERPAFVVLRMPKEYDALHKEMVENLKKQSDLFVKFDIGQG
ncbi:MAG: hypothetical protein GPJ50_12310, partial [Candidatus Heimdallarchaeota archaeon]|nr:hypothetical protein [Candidatus Heimdallarchaeota archaeon]